MQGPHPVQSGFLPSATLRAAPASGPGPVRDAVQRCLKSKDRAGILTIGKAVPSLQVPARGPGRCGGKGSAPSKPFPPHHDRLSATTARQPEHGPAVFASSCLHRSTPARTGPVPRRVYDAQDNNVLKAADQPQLIGNDVWQASDRLLVSAGDPARPAGRNPAKGLTRVAQPVSDLPRRNWIILGNERDLFPDVIQRCARPHNRPLHLSSAPLITA